MLNCGLRSLLVFVSLKSNNMTDDFGTLSDQFAFFLAVFQGLV